MRTVVMDPEPIMIMVFLINIPTFICTNIAARPQVQIDIKRIK